MKKPLSDKVLLDPENKFVKLMFYMYSMEPPLYADLNRACRSMDETKLHSLGPYARVIFHMLNWGSVLDSKRPDPLKMGKEVGHDSLYGKYDGSFMTFKGVIMFQG